MSVLEAHVAKATRDAAQINTRHFILKNILNINISSTQYQRPSSINNFVENEYVPVNLETGSLSSCYDQYRICSSDVIKVAKTCKTEYRFITDVVLGLSV